MKDQLSKLKDMLEIVKTTETVVQNSNGNQEVQELACEVCTKAENLLHKENDNKPATPRRSPSIGHHDTNTTRFDNTANNETPRYKHSNNKNATTTTGYGGTRPKTTTNSNKLALQTELEAKKRELEEIMGKHKGKIAEKRLKKNKITFS